MGHKRRLSKQNIVVVVVAILVVASIFSGWKYYRHTIGADEIVSGPADEFGVQSGVASLPTDAEKQLAINKTAAAGFGWMRQEFYYEDPINFANYDTVARMARERGIKTLGLLSYPGPERNHEQWKAYVSAVATHYKDDVAAWEVMNEIDNYLSPAEYVVYLKEARDIIKQINPNATIVLSGITSRPEAARFWDGVAANGGWNYFDVVGLHHYHRQYPERVNFGGGDLTAELSRPISTIRLYGPKKIWVTEIGYIDSVGRENQANWLARNLTIARSIPEIDKLFIYRLSNKQADFPFGLLDDGMNEFPVYGSIKRAMAQLTGKGTGTKVLVEDRTEHDPINSLSGWSIPDKKNATGNLSLVGGTDGTAMRIDYKFSADQAYVVAGKNIQMGQPQAIAAWFYGDDSNNVWKYRFTDAKGEVWQADLGAIPSGWSFKQFVLGSDTALVSWGGDSKIDYPITFSSVVIDRQGGKDHGYGIVDEITAVTANADLSVHQFGSQLFYWKTSGSGSYDVCGTRLDFSETPKVAAGIKCQDKSKVVIDSSGKKVAAQSTPRKATPKPVAIVASPVPSPVVETPTPVPSVEPSAAPSVEPTATPILSVDPDQSRVVVAGESVPADGYSRYRLNITLKDASGQAITDQAPRVSEPEKEATTASSKLFITRPVLVDDSWQVNVSSTSSGQYPVLVAAAQTSLGTAQLHFAKTSLDLNAVDIISHVLEVYRSIPYSGVWFGLLIIALIAVAYLVVSLIVHALYLLFHELSTPEYLIEYIRKQRRDDLTDAYIFRILIEAGWPEKVVRQAFGKAGNR